MGGGRLNNVQGRRWRSRSRPRSRSRSTTGPLLPASRLSVPPLWACCSGVVLGWRGWCMCVCAYACVCVCVYVCVYVCVCVCGGLSSSWCSAAPPAARWAAPGQRLSYTTLSDLALALIDGTVYEIVQGLLDIQHLTEKNLFNQRQKLHTEHRILKQDLSRKHKQALQVCKSHNLTLLKATQRTETEALEQRVREEQRMMDEKIIAEIDQKVLDQQNTLEKAGVPGFYITNNPQEVTMQMNLLELILKLQQKESQSGTLP